MFFRKCEKKGHPYLALVVGALAVVGALSLKKCGMDFMKQKWQKLTSAIKNMDIPMCGMNNGNEN